MTVRSRIRTGLAAGAGIAAMLGAGMAPAADFDLKVAHVASSTTPVQICIDVMEGYMERMSGGRIDVQSYPAGQLGNFRQNVEQVQLGSLELTFTTGGGISNLFGPIQAFDIPYLLKNDRVVNKVMEDDEINQTLGDDLLEALKTVRLVGLSGNHGWRSFFIDKGPTNNLPGDWQGKKIRTIESPISMELARAVGLNPTPIPWQELYTSLATGIVYGTKNSLMDIINMDFDQYLKYLFRDQHTYIMFFWYMHDPFLQKLPPELQTVFVDGMDRLKAVCTGPLRGLHAALLQGVRRGWRRDLRADARAAAVPAQGPAGRGEVVRRPVRHHVSGHDPGCSGAGGREDRGGGHACPRPKGDALGIGPRRAIGAAATEILGGRFGAPLFAGQDPGSDPVTISLPLLRLRHDTKVRPGSLPSFREFLLCLFIRHGRDDDDVLALFPVHRRGHLMLGRELA